jgi:hypothetical protein
MIQEKMVALGAAEWHPPVASRATGLLEMRDESLLRAACRSSRGVFDFYG